LVELHRFVAPAKLPQGFDDTEIDGADAVSQADDPVVCGSPFWSQFRQSPFSRFSFQIVGHVSNSITICLDSDRRSPT
jgi:hypothetical protein